MFDEEESTIIPGHYDIYKSVADVLYRNGNYRKAADSYTVAMNFRPDDRISLVCRSMCYLKLGNAVEALKDAEKSMVDDKDYHRGMFQKAEVLFNQGDFEMALVFYHRGNQRRPDLIPFWLGIQKAKEAIVNCVGTPDRVKLDTTGDLSFFKTMYGKKEKKKPRASNKKVVEVKKRNMERSMLRDRSVRSMLGDLYGDKVYMENLLKRIESTDVHSDTGKEISRLAEEGLDYLDTRTEFWQQVKPMYARKYEQRLAYRQYRPPKTTSHEYILAQLDRLDSLMAESNYGAALKRAVHTMNILDNYTVAQLASLHSFRAKVHSVHGNAALELGDYTNATKHHQTDRDIGLEHGIPDAVSRGLDNLGRVYARIGKFYKAIEVWERKLPLCKTPLEATWLCHELGRCYLEIDKAKVAKDYGERSLAAAQEAEDDMWQLHALVLISQAEVKSDHLSSSLISFEIAYDMADLLMDQTAQTAIKRAIDDVNTRISNREQQAAEYDRKDFDDNKSNASVISRGNESRQSAATFDSDAESLEEEEEEEKEGDPEDLSTNNLDTSAIDAFSTFESISKYD